MAKKNNEIKKEEQVELISSEPVKLPDQFLSDAARNQIISKLQGYGLSTDGLNDQQLLDALSNYADQMTSQAVNKESESLTQALEVYAEGSVLTDIEFIERLYMWSVPQFYLLAEHNLIRNEDKALSKDQLWEKIRYSGIRPIEDIREVLKARYKLPKKEKSLAQNKLRR